MQLHVIFAVMKRNLASYFSGLLGYLFIVVFVVLGALCAFQNEFFRGNQCTLDQLSEWYPWLLLFIVPAITMNAWSEERRRGTDELLFTLPGTDVEILLGKYLAVVVVYSIALVFSLTHVLVLEWLGNPDPYRLFATYCGYWCAGCALLATGMVASALTNSAAVAFVLGAVFCAVPVGLSLVPGLENTLKPMTVGYHIDEFSRGTIPFLGLFYFASLAAVMLYLNTALIARRRWRKSGGMHLRWHYLIRGISLAAILISVGYVVSALANWSIDMTEEGLYTLADVTHQTLAEINPEQTVTIEAYISAEVGVPYDRVKSELEGILRRVQSLASNKLAIHWYYLGAFTDDEVRAEENGIEPQTYIRDDETTTHATVEKVYLGLVVKRGDERVVIPFVDLGTSIEYELTRAIGTVIQQERMSIGILETAAQINARPANPENEGENLPPWRIIQELEKQYEVVDVDPTTLNPFQTISNERGWTTELVAATGETLLNSLDAIDTPFVDGDVIVISGNERRPTAAQSADADAAAGQDNEVAEIREEFAVGPETTLADLVAKVDEAFASATATLDPEGRLILTANDKGPQDLAFELTNGRNNTGRLRFDLHELERQQDFDVLLAVLPSTLQDPQMGPFVEYVRAGYPTLIFDDPMTAFQPQLALMRSEANFQGMPQPPSDAARLKDLMELLQCTWESDSEIAGRDFVLMDNYNPHPNLDYVPPTAVFIAPQPELPGERTVHEINPNHPATAGLQEILAFFPGTIRLRRGHTVEFTPLLRSGSRFSGLVDWDDLFQRSRSGQILDWNDDPDYEAGTTQRVLSNRSGWTANGEPAVAATLLNDLDDIDTPFEDGDVVIISGVELRPGEGDDDSSAVHTVNHRLEVDGTTTLGALVEQIDQLFESADAQLSSNGRIILTAIEPGTTTLELTLTNDRANTGQLLFDFNPMEVESQGSEGESHVIAAAIQSTGESTDRINVIFVADSDMLSDTSMRFESQQQFDLILDNSRFVMNAIDTLAGHQEYVSLRSRRSGSRTLTAIQQVQQEAHEEFLNLARQVRREERYEREDAQARFDRRVREIGEDTTLSPIALTQEIANANEDANIRLNGIRERIERQTEREIENLVRQEQLDVRAAERNAWVWAVCVPPIPAALLGIVMFVLRLSRERSMISPDRRLRRAA